MKAICHSDYKDSSFIFDKSQLVSLPDQKPLFHYEFIKKGRIRKNKRIFYFYEDCCFFLQVIFEKVLRYFFAKKNRTSTKAKGYLKYDFELKIEWKYNKSGKAISFKFLKNNASSKIIFAKISEAQILELQEYFRRRINFYDFHKYFNAIKKIGKGNFASVYLAESLRDGKQYAVKAFAKKNIYESEKNKVFDLFIFFFGGRGGGGGEGGRKKDSFFLNF